MDNLVLLSASEQQLRIAKLREQMALSGITSAIISGNANKYYLTGRVFSGYIYLRPDSDEPIYFVKRPVHLLAPITVSIRKPESMVSELKIRGLEVPHSGLGLELGNLTYAMAQRLIAAFELETPMDLTICLSRARSVKTPDEIALLEASARKHEWVYRQIPKLYAPGMSDLELQIEIERLSRIEGCLGQFRVAGDDMELFMGNVLAGDNADAPSPYDFAMGGAGMHPSLPVGANGTLLRPGMAVMVDMNGDYTGYMTDMTRTFAVGSIDELGRFAHQVSIDICHELASMGVPGTEAKAMYERGLEMAQEAGLQDYFMGHRQHAGFIGHGIGIEVNELPVIAPRSRDVLVPGNVIAIEPKFVIPGVGAVGIENTYIVEDSGMRSITNTPEQLIELE